MKIVDVYQISVWEEGRKALIWSQDSTTGVRARAGVGADRFVGYPMQQLGAMVLIFGRVRVPLVCGKNILRFKKRGAVGCWGREQIYTHRTACACWAHKRVHLVRLLLCYVDARAVEPLVAPEALKHEAVCASSAKAVRTMMASNMLV